ncbi:MAG: methylthioribose-1-phosphate isomerase [Planctomycetota bacterium]|jgi:methylthioribose-1-phosphate isomerase
MSAPFFTIEWEGERDGHVRMLEQTLLPTEHVILEVRDVPQMVDAIYRLAVRGAPAIGVAAGFGVVLGLRDEVDPAPDDLLGKLREVAATLAKARPTAVNLFWALDRMVDHGEALHARGLSGAEMLDGLFVEAQLIHSEDVESCLAMGRFGAELLKDGMTILTHCNAGALATAGRGTALAPIYQAHLDGKKVAVYSDETRPLLQGARLTSWELMQAGIPVTLLVDGAAGTAMKGGRIDAVIVGSDRIARNGDVCNKIGTYGVATLAKANGIPFYVVAPLSTFDAKLDSGDQIPIEERPAEEVTCGFGKRTAPEGVKVYNPAFDVTPAELVTAIVTDAGVIHAPNMERVEAMLAVGNSAK